LRSDWIISGVAHTAVLATALVSFAYPMPAADTSQFMPVTIVTADVSKATRGQPDAPKPKTDPKPLADKIDVPKIADQTADKVADKPEIKTETQAKPQPKPDPKPAEKPKPKTPDYKPDQIADLLKKDVAKQPPKADDKTPPDKTAPNSPKFDASQVAQLLDKRDPRRQTATADALNNQANIGSSTGAAAQLSQDEIGALKARISSCWSPPPGIDASTKVVISLRVLLKPDGSLAQQPVMVEGTPSPLGLPLAESAKRAVMSCQPYTMLRPEHYQLWKDLQLDFDPRELLGNG
jgi:outer membrane biosynthesis protein TonB